MSATYQKTTIGGRAAVVGNLGRVRSKIGRRFYNLMSVRFDDNGEYWSGGAAEFAKWATARDKAWAAANAPKAESRKCRLFMAP